MLVTYLLLQGPAMMQYYFCYCCLPFEAGSSSVAASESFQHCCQDRYCLFCVATSCFHRPLQTSHSDSCCRLLPLPLNRARRTYSNTGYTVNSKLAVQLLDRVRFACLFQKV